MKLSVLIVTLTAVLAMAATLPASAEPLFTNTTLYDITACHNTSAYPYDELQACDRAMHDLDSQAKVTSDQIDLQHIDLQMVRVGVIEGLLTQHLGLGGSGDLFGGARLLVRAILDNAASAEIADDARSILRTMNEQGL